MAKLIDYISITLLFFALTFVWTSLAFKNLAASLIASTAFSIIAIITVRKFTHKDGKPYTYDRLEFEFCIQGNKYVIDLLKSTIKNAQIESGENHILLENAILIANYKFSILSMSDMCQMCNLAKKLERQEVFVLCKGIDRRAFEVAVTRNVKVNQVKTKSVYRFLKKHNALADLKPVKHKFSIKGLFEAIFSRRNFKSYIFSVCVLIFTAFLTPLKPYYLVFASLSLLFAIICLTPLGNGSLASPKAFDLLEKQLETEYVKQSADNLTHDNKDTRQYAIDSESEQQCTRNNENSQQCTRNNENSRQRTSDSESAQRTHNSENTQQCANNNENTFQCTNDKDSEITSNTPTSQNNDGNIEKDVRHNNDGTPKR